MNTTLNANQPQDDDVVHVIVSEKPQHVWVVLRGRMHHGRWRTVNPGESGIDDKTVDGSSSLLTAMNAWSGQRQFTTTYGELVANSGGYGITV